MRLFEHGLRRAGFPLSLSAGFDPRPRVTFLSALPLGVESVDEWVEIELTQALEAGEFMTRLPGQFPEGVRVKEAGAAVGRVAAVEAEYEADLAGAPVDAAALLARKEIPVERRVSGRPPPDGGHPSVDPARGVGGRKTDVRDPHHGQRVGAAGGGPA